jgi:hypothetical protein
LQKLCKAQEHGDVLQLYEAQEHMLCRNHVFLDMAVPHASWLDHASCTTVYYQLHPEKDAALSLFLVKYFKTQIILYKNY